MLRVLSSHTPPHKKKRFSFSLLEAMIALTLFMIVTSSIFGLYRHQMKTSEKLSSLQSESEALMRAHSRLLDVFSSVIMKTQKYHYFFTPEKHNSSHSDTPSLIFTFDNGIKREVGFSYDVIARLTVTKKGELALFTWPNTRLQVSRPSNVHKEVLLENIQAIQFEFWQGTPDKNNSANEQKSEWVDVWPKSKRDRPLLLRLTITYQAKKNQEPEEKKFLFITNTSAIKAFQVGGI